MSERRASLEEIEQSIYIALKVMPKHLKTRLKSGLSDDNTHAVAKHIVDKMHITEAIKVSPAVHHSTAERVHSDPLIVLPNTREKIGMD